MNASRLALLAVGAGLLTTTHAAPLVVGFDRFHAAAPTAAGGRLLFNELGCANCHGSDTGLPARRGPNLVGVLQRVNPKWVDAFLQNPGAAHAGSAMPQLVAKTDREAVVHYLGSLKVKPVKSKVSKHVNAARGNELFHDLGCVACHAPSADFQPPEGTPAAADFTYPAVSFPALAEKYTLASLAEFIRDPLKIRPDGRMPKLAMEEQDAVDVAGYLLKFEGSDGSLDAPLPPFTADQALAERGRTTVAAARCAACHELPAEVAASKVALTKTDSGCLASQPAAGVPHYDLSAAQRSALALFLQQRDKEATPHELANLTLQSLNCVACHERDGQGGPDAGRKAYFQGDHNLGDTGKYPPPLTEVGRKLQPEWLAKVLSGEYRVRPYIHTRMPVYGTATAKLGPLLAQADAKPEPALPGGDDTAGRKLLGTNGGLGCITCHRWGTHSALGIQALDLSQIGQRLQPGWLREYLIDPAGHRPGTLMPSFWPGGKASNTEILGGNTDKQIASIYSFAKSANGEPEGFPATANGQFELIPKDRAIVQRTFMEGAGTHTILVGFPSGYHFAYDGKSGRPALAWKGRFFDAYNTWFSRFAPFEKPLGTDVAKWPTGSTSDPALRFDGYRLDPKGNPTFILNVAGARVEEHYEGIASGLRRTITAEADALRNFPIAHPEGIAVQEETAPSPKQRIFTYSWK